MPRGKLSTVNCELLFTRDRGSAQIFVPVDFAPSGVPSALAHFMNITRSQKGVTEGLCREHLFCQ